jgi:GNAT superfamily N-acetyltransferase
MRLMRVREGLELLRSSRGRQWLVRNTRRRFYSQTISIGVRRDLTVPFPVPPAKIPLLVRKLRPDDDLSLVADTPDLTPEAARHRADQRWLLNSDLPPPWVAIDPDGAVCYIGYVFTAQDNPRMQALWGPLAPVLQPDEALLEGIFTSERHRGLGVLLDAGTQSVEQARELGVRYAIGIAGEKNIGTLKAAEKAGWIPRFKRIDRWFLFRQRVTFVPLD